MLDFLSEIESPTSPIETMGAAKRNLLGYLKVLADIEIERIKIEKKLAIQKTSNGLNKEEL